MRNLNFCGAERRANSMVRLGYNSGSGTLLHMKLTKVIEQKLRNTMIALFGH